MDESVGADHAVKFGVGVGPSRGRCVDAAVVGLGIRGRECVYVCVCVCVCV